jgi:hypothetical protein
MEKSTKLLLAVSLIIITAMIVAIVILRTVPEEENNKEYVCEQNCVVTLDTNPKTEGLYIGNQHILLGSYEGKNLNEIHILYSFYNK